MYVELELTFVMVILKFESTPLKQGTRLFQIISERCVLSKGLVQRCQVEVQVAWR